jgi:hypothetical protein
VAARLGYPVPDELLAVYRDPALLAAPPFRVPGLDGYSAELTSFMPLDAQTLEETFSTGDHSFPFADNFYGDPFFVPLDECRPGYCPVYHLYHDGGSQPERLADSLGEWLARRHPATD